MQVGSTFLDAVICLVVVYIAFSLLVSWINEQIATMLQWRSKTLFDGIAKMLSDADTYQKLRGSPIITAACEMPGKMPSYLSSGQFRCALLSAIGTGKTIVTDATSAFADATAAVSSVPAGPLRNTLTALLAQSAGDYDVFVASIEGWFDDTMARVSGWYKRSAAICVTVIATFVVLVTNVDSIRLLYTFECNSALRTAITSAAGQAASSGNADALSRQLFQSLPFYWYTSEKDAPCASGGSNSSPHSGFLQTPAWLAPKILGLAISVAALTLGAPFWFDALKKLMNVRNTGQEPTSST